MIMSKQILVNIPLLTD